MVYTFALPEKRLYQEVQRECSSIRRRCSGAVKATPSGVFDWTQSGQSRAWGAPNQRFRNIQKDIPKTLLAYVIRNFRYSKFKLLPCEKRTANNLKFY
ncbi:hypothetical protein ADH76_29610 [Enterocloster clostridioformis]|nr:hypothetical protein A4V08_04635 [Lachnoclostridium sp. YL32]OXE63499.1 hypothetical protein ADH76_29610 [Enterocloster clostridioformis]